MDTGKLKTFAQEARLKLISLVRAKLEHISKLDPQGYSAKLKAKSEQVEKLLSDVRSKGFESVVDEGAYVWFNRLTALRFMDGKGYNRVRALSP
ncbi:MAG: restriction endonuclease, partial [Synergistales bacterium]|nr:restriction endonuclease [Synergistales bacterium]